VGQADPQGQPRPDDLLNRDGLCCEHQRVSEPGRDHGGSELDARGGPAHRRDGGEGVGNRELGEPVGGEAVSFGLGGVFGDLADRSAGGDET